MPPLTRGQRQLAAAQAQIRSQDHFRQQGRQNIDNFILQRIQQATARLERLKDDARFYIQLVTNAIQNNNTSLAKLRQFHEQINNIIIALEHYTNLAINYLESINYPLNSISITNEAIEIQNRLILLRQQIEEALYRRVR